MTVALYQKNLATLHGARFFSASRLTLAEKNAMVSRDVAGDSRKQRDMNLK